MLLLEKGNDLFHRSCPIIQGKVCPALPGGNKTYPGCQPACSITNGFGGAGAWSDGKFNITTEFGGWMTDYLSTAQVLELLEYVDKINLEHGATPEITNPNTEAVRKIEARAYAAGLKLLRAKVRHRTETILKFSNLYTSTSGTKSRCASAPRWRTSSPSGRMGP